MRTTYAIDPSLAKVSPGPELSWRALYEAAIFEDDRSKLAERVAAAENALRFNANSLGDQHGNAKELRDMESAMYFLRLLTQAWD
jgi:hypothetical protein